MPVRIRLARHGQKHAPVFHLVAINATKARDARPLEKLGEYDPIARISQATGPLPPKANVFGPDVFQPVKEKRIEWDVERIRYWLGVGAQPTRSVIKLLERGGVLTVPHKWQHKWSPPAPGAVAEAAKVVAEAPKEEAPAASA